MTTATLEKPAPAPPAATNARTRQRRRAPATGDVPAPASTAITGDERARLVALEAIVARGRSAWLEAGRALDAIQREGLYRVAFPTWGAYVRHRWGMGEARASQMRTAARVADALQQQGVELPPLSEEAIRQLAPTLRERGPDDLRAAWHHVADRCRPGRLPGADAVRDVLRQHGYPTYGTAPTPGRAPRADHLQATLDGLLARVDRIAGREDRFDPLELERLADVARELADRLEQLARPAAAPEERVEERQNAADDLCMDHGARRDSRGVCTACRRPDLRDTSGPASR